MENLKKYLAYNPETFEFAGFYKEGRKDLPDTVVEVDPETFLVDKGQHTHYNPDTGWYTEEVVLTDEQIRSEFKSSRSLQVSNIKVTVDGMDFDGDEESQNRLVRAITALDPEETTLWVLADNTAVYPTREQLKQVLRLAGEAQSLIWVQ